jgi:hypothetical protein
MIFQIRMSNISIFRIPFQPITYKLIAMKFFLLPAFVLLSYSFIPCNSSVKNNLLKNIDTAVINHLLDGKTSEWPANKFEQDNATNIKYAVDNDAANLYIALIVPDFRSQIKMMKQGMELYIDVKGKKRQDKGIEFPVRKAGNFSSNDYQNSQRQKPDIKEIRSMMGLNLLSLQLIGFSDEELKDQNLMQPGSANIQYTWDDADIMYIEYSIPLNLFGNNSLNQKIISIGWKLNGGEANSSSPVYTTTTVVGVPSNGRSGRVTLPANTTPDQSFRQNANDGMKEQSFWTKYTVTIGSK